MGKIILKVANLVPGVFILSFNFSSSAPFGPETVISTTQDLDLRVQIEISHVMRILQDSGEIDKIQRGKLAGFIEGLAKRTILAEREVKSQCGEHAILENEKFQFQFNFTKYSHDLLLPTWYLRMLDDPEKIDLKKRGILEGFIEGLAQRAILAEREADDRLKKIGI